MDRITKSTGPACWRKGDQKYLPWQFASRTPTSLGDSRRRSPEPDRGWWEGLIHRCDARQVGGAYTQVKQDRWEELIHRCDARQDAHLSVSGRTDWPGLTRLWRQAV